VKTGAYISEYITGTYGALSVLAANRYRHECGQGQDIDLAAVDAVQNTTIYGALRQSYMPQIVSRRRGGSYEVVECKDGFVGINIQIASHWAPFCAFVGRPDLVDDPRFNTAPARMQNSEELGDIIRQWARSKSRSEVFEANQWRIPLTIIPNMSEVFEYEQHAARQFFAKRTISETHLLQPSAPFRMTKTPSSILRPAPDLGEHSDEVLSADADATSGDIRILKQQGVI
jgi:formyl-CoA transferase